MTEATPSGHREPAAPERPADAGPRKDIQALRAIAVTLVVVYHFWPNRLTGGYVGVDVFFVISGFLITLHLLQRPIRRLSDLFAFWARRVRRLIPAATLVLLVTLGASLLWLPQTVHQRVANEVIASALYVENWMLALTSTDYLATDQLHSPTQHYWSLSVEEQFYILWPVLIGLAFLVCRRLGRSFRFAPLGVILVVSGASLAFSAWLTQDDPASAYFVSTTRIWELGVGAALAAAVHAGLSLRGALVRSVLLWGGLAAIAWSSWTFTGGTPFPGVAALLPTVGTAAVIAARSDDLRPGPFSLWSRRPVQWLGDVSYSVYLWHWPAIVIIPFVLDDDNVRWWQKLLLLGLVLVLSALTKRWVEDLMRFTPRIARSTKRSFVLLAVCLAASLGAAGIAHVAIARADAQTSGPIPTGASCVGADYFRTASCAGRQVAMLTNPSRAAKDKPQVYADGCWNDRPFTSRKVCSYGPSSTPVRIALYGNSHAGQWFPPLERLARERGWHIDTYLASECYAVDAPVSFNPPQLTTNCQAYNQWAQGRIRSGGYTLVVMANRTLQPLVGVPAARKTAVAEASYTRVVNSFLRSGLKVLAIRDTPNAGHNVPDCLSRYADTPERCDARQSTAIEPDPLASAVSSGGLPHDRVQLLDATALLCNEGKCPGIIGGLITFFDHGHMTESFSSTLYPEVKRAAQSILGSKF
ncbi:acyltransferase family protein [Intrasporangium sp. YIM S08009]|uniref:acyltransferase family protein n=1 Tax=Intrasporangium zincisolvens TaxID=3080018 RepID=UPI002B057C68|nr:acyltransferase family protein [Intrasporangium sp. YIM S08009]